MRRGELRKDILRFVVEFELQSMEMKLQANNLIKLKYPFFQAHSSYQSGALSGGAVRNLQPLPLNRNGTAPSAPLAPLPTQPVKRDGIKEWYV